MNISRLLATKIGLGENICLRGRGLTIRQEPTYLHVCRESVSSEDRVLVVAPHPDDAEIAAFGLYTDTRASVITITAGDSSDRYRNLPQPWNSLSRSAVAKLRVWDSLTVPQMGGVPFERVANLCFPDARLADLHRNPLREFSEFDSAALDFIGLRGLNRSPLLREDTICTWKSLVSELAHIIAKTSPTIVVTPHPRLDPHPDHFFTTVALGEALKSVGGMTGRIFFYAVHNRRSELWPFGPAGSGVTLLPMHSEDGVCGSGFYSHQLSLERQQQKFLALEAMHDLREVQWPDNSPGQFGAQVASALRTLARGMDAAPTSYFRRAARPDELFFVTSFECGVELIIRELERCSAVATDA